MSVDARVQSAIDHWAPRFVQAGMDYNDFIRTSAAVERWEDWLDAFRRLGDAHADRARDAAAAGRDVTAREAWHHAAVAYHFGRFVWVLDAARARTVGDLAVAALYAAQAGTERVEVPFDGSRIVGNLRRPEGIRRPPLVLLIPGLDSTKEEFFRLEGVFLARGMAALSLDGPGQGEGGYELAIRPDYEVPAGAMLDALTDRDDLDLGRVGALGVSLGGYHAPRAAAFEPRIRAVAGISGAYNFGALWDHIPELTRETFTHKSHATSDADARTRALELDLAGVLARLEAPALFVTGMRDRLIPWESTRRQADEAPHGEFVGLEEGNHVCANVPYIARPLVADWLREQLG